MNPGGDVFFSNGGGTEEMTFEMMKFDHPNINFFEDQTYSQFEDAHRNDDAMAIYKYHDQYRHQGEEAFLLLREQEYFYTHGHGPETAIVAVDGSIESSRIIASRGSVESTATEITTSSCSGSVGSRKKHKQRSSSALPTNFSSGSVELGNSGLEEIPVAIFDTRHPIKIVYLQDNKIHKLPANFFDDLPYLAWCDLRFNEIAALPDITKRHDTLRVLLLQDNALSSLPYTMGVNAVKLRTLSLRGNPLYDPPKDIIDAGLDAIKSYMIQESNQPGAVTKNCSHKYSHKKKKSVQKRPKDRSETPRYENGNQNHTNYDDVEDWADFISPQISSKTNQSTPNFTKSLYKSIAGYRRKLKLDKKGRSVETSKTKETESRPFFRGMSHKAATQLKYTNDVWRDIPFDGKSERELLHKSLEEMRQHVSRKFSIQKEKMLQRIKDREVLNKWRFETRILQKAGRRPGTCCLVAPPYGVSSDEIIPDDSPNQMLNLKYIHMTPEDFKNEINACSLKLQYFIENPTSITDSETALQRLSEVEEIQQKLCCLKLTTNGRFPLPH